MTALNFVNHVILFGFSAMDGRETECVTIPRESEIERLKDVKGVKYQKYP